MIVIAVVAFAVLNFLTPEYHDDFVYKFIFEGGTVNYDHPVRSIGDIVVSQVEHYQSVNGRSLVHFLVQLFTGVLGKPVYNIMNAIIFGLFLLLLKRYAFRQTLRQGRELFAVSLTLVLVLLLPRFKDTFLWMTGSVNYLWSATAALLFLLMYERRRERTADKSLVLPVIGTLMLGWTHEGITLPLGAALTIISLVSFKKNRDKQGLWLALAYLGGAILTAIAPGTIARSGMTGGLSASTLGLKLIAGLSVMGKLRLVYLALLVGVILWFTDRSAIKRTITRDGHLPLAALLSLIIIFCSGQTLTRAAFGLELFSMVFVLSLIREAMDRWDKSIIKWCGIGFTVALVAFYTLLLRHTIPSWQESQRLIAQIEQTTTAGGIIGTQEHNAGILNDYICTLLTRDATANAMNYNPKSWPSSIAATYHRDSLVFLPQAFIEDLKSHPNRYDSLDLNTPWEFYIQRIDEDTVINSVTFNLDSNDFKDVPALLRPIARRMNRYAETTVTTTKWATLDLYDKRYLLIKKDHELASRITDIVISRGQR